MHKLITRLFSNDVKSEYSEKGSFIRFGAKFEGQVNENLLSIIIPWILGISVAGGGAYLGISHIYPSSNIEVINKSTQVDTVKKSSDLKQIN